MKIKSNIFVLFSIVTTSLFSDGIMTLKEAKELSQTTGSTVKIITKKEADELIIKSKELIHQEALMHTIPTEEAYYSTKISKDINENINLTPIQHENISTPIVVIQEQEPTVEEFLLNLVNNFNSLNQDQFFQHKEKLVTMLEKKNVKNIDIKAVKNMTMSLESIKELLAISKQLKI